MVAGLVPPLVFAGFVAWQLRPAALTSGDGRSGFALAADAECDRTTKRLDDLARKEVNDPSEFAAKAVAIVRESVAAMRKLKPPRNVRVQADAFVDGLEEAADVADEARAALDAGDFERLELIALSNVVDPDELRGLALSIDAPACAHLAGFS